MTASRHPCILDFLGFSLLRGWRRRKCTADAGIGVETTRGTATTMEPQDLARLMTADILHPHPSFRRTQSAPLQHFLHVLSGVR